jgi:hypothetical protein
MAGTGNATLGWLGWCHPPNATHLSPSTNASRQSGAIHLPGPPTQCDWRPNLRQLFLADGESRSTLFWQTQLQVVGCSVGATHEWHCTNSLSSFTQRSYLLQPVACEAHFEVPSSTCIGLSDVSPLVVQIDRADWQRGNWKSHAGFVDNRLL